MTEARQCSQCGATLNLESLLGLCQKCQLAAVLEETGSLSGDFNPSKLEPGRQFGDYQLGRQIGRGGMGVVYEALHVSLRRTVALKMILDSHGASPSLRRRFAVEAEAAAKLDHPNIVPIYEVGEHDDQPYLSMKLVQGESLRKKMLVGELGVATKVTDPSKSTVRTRQTDVVRLLASVARAVHHAHEHGVLHRDLKPGNILIDRAGQPHLTDFGLAKILDTTSIDGPQGPLTGSDCILGTPAYMSPEQAGNQRLTAAADVYSLGAMLYELLTGEPPFKGGTALETIRMVVEQEPRHPSTLLHDTDADLDTICMKCLEKNPDARYISALALAEDLERWLRQEPIRARRVGPGARLARWVRRNPVGASLIASLCAGLTLALVLLQVALDRQHRLDLIRANSVQKFSEKVEDLWRDPNVPFIEIEQSDLVALADLTLREPDPTTLKLTYALSINENPVNQAMRWAPWLQEIERRMEKLLGQPVVFNLRLFKFNSNLERPVIRGEADFQKLGALTYLRAKQATPGLQPLALEKRGREAVIFARKELGLSNLAQVAGYRVAFAHTNSIISFLAKVRLARAGVCTTNLKQCDNLDYGTTKPDWIGQSKSRSGSGTDGEFESYAHKEVLNQVVANTYDVGVGQRRHFELNKHKGLVELHSYAVPYDVHVAGSNVAPAVVGALRATMLSMAGRHDNALLARLASTTVSGFEPVSDRYLDELRAALTNELRHFEAGQPTARAAP